MLQFVGHIENMACNEVKFFSNYKESPIYRGLVENRMNFDEDTTVTFTDLWRIDCVDNSIYTGENYIIVQEGSVVHCSHLRFLVAISSGKVEHISAATACMRTSHLRMVTFE